MRGTREVSSLEGEERTRDQNDQPRNLFGKIEI